MGKILYANTFFDKGGREKRENFYLEFFSVVFLTRVECFEGSGVELPGVEKGLENLNIFLKVLLT